MHFYHSFVAVVDVVITAVAIDNDANYHDHDLRRIFFLADTMDSMEREEMEEKKRFFARASLMIELDFVFISLLF